MARDLIANVNVDGTWYGPDHQGNKVNADVEKAVTNPKVWGAPAESTDSGEVKEPPRKGPGSGQDAWTTFARQVGVTETFDSKDALIKALEDQGKIAKV